MGSVVNGEGWIGERLKFLRGRLAEDPPAEERAVIEAEIERLDAERGITVAGVRVPRFLGRILRRR